MSPLANNLLGSLCSRRHFQKSTPPTGPLSTWIVTRDRTPIVLLLSAFPLPDINFSFSFLECHDWNGAAGMYHTINSSGQPQYREYGFMCCIILHGEGWSLIVGNLFASGWWGCCGAAPSHLPASRQRTPSPLGSWIVSTPATPQCITESLRNKSTKWAHF